MTKKIYIIAGPTASGKTKIGIDLAKQLGGQIINADSIQVYEDVPLLTACPTAEEMSIVKHHLFAYLDAKQNNSVNDWLLKVSDIIDDIEVPVFVGGTGLYIKSLMEGLSDIPEIPEQIRYQVRKMSIEELKEALPNAKFTDPQRLMRALEVFKATGKTLDWWYEQPKKQFIKNAEFKTIVLLPEREKLYSQCNYRFEKMMSSGALRQVVELIQKNPQMDGGVFQALGVSDLISFIQGNQTLESAIKHAQQLTRNYAKRQMTWFRHQLKADLLLKEPVLPENIETLLK